MNWTELLKHEVGATFGPAAGLLDLVDEDRLDWKPATGSNWMTVGQLLRHLSEACGAACKGCVTGDWGLPEGMDLSDLKPEEMLPPAEKMPAVASVKEARRRLHEDRELALAMIDQAGEERLASEECPVPWDPTPITLGHRLLQMVAHLDQHKGQLFYYLKLQGKPVDTSHLWGM